MTAGDPAWAEAVMRVHVLSARPVLVGAADRDRTGGQGALAGFAAVSSGSRDGKVVELRNAHTLCLVGPHDKADGTAWNWIIRIGRRDGLPAINPEFEVYSLLSFDTRADR